MPSNGEPRIPRKEFFFYIFVCIIIHYIHNVDEKVSGETNENTILSKKQYFYFYRILHNSYIGSDIHAYKYTIRAVFYIIIHLYETNGV